MSESPIHSVNKTMSQALFKIVNAPDDHEVMRSIAHEALWEVVSMEMEYRRNKKHEGEVSV